MIHTTKIWIDTLQARVNQNSFPNPNISNMGKHPDGSIIFNAGSDYFLFDPIKKELVKNNFGFPDTYGNGDFTTSGNIAHFTVGIEKEN